MTALSRLEQTIFDVDGVRVELSGNAPITAAYWTNRFNANGTVADFRRRFATRYPGIEMVVFDGIGARASGLYLMKNLRATYEFSWIRDRVSVFHDMVTDQKKQIRALKKALRKAEAAADTVGDEEEDDAFDPYAELGVAREASDEEIRMAFKKRMSLFHPDKFNDKDPLVLDYITEKAQRLNRAREEIAGERSVAEAA